MKTMNNTHCVRRSNVTCFDFVRRAKNALLTALSMTLLLASTSAFSQTITFTLTNGVIQPGPTPRYQYEVWAKSSDGTSRTGSVLVYLNYNPTTFGRSVVFNGTVTVTKNVAVFDASYIQVINDNTATRFAMALSRNPGPLGVVLPSTGDGVLMFTVQMNILCPCTADLSFQLSLMNGEQYFDDEATPWPVVAGINNLPSEPLPVQLVSFTGTRQSAGAVRLNWRTISEVNNYGFYVQRKRQSDPIFTELPNSFIAGHGTTNEPQNYSFTDNNAPQGNLQYRLKQVDLDGTEHFTEPISVNGVTSVNGFESAPREFSLKQNYPNPFNPSTEIKFSVESSGQARLDIFNVAGQQVGTLFNETAIVGQYYKVKFDATNFPSGVYFYRLESGKQFAMKKLLLLK